jgi:hypothetical protein
MQQISVMDKNILKDKIHITKRYYQATITRHGCHSDSQNKDIINPYGTVRNSLCFKKWNPL